MKFLRENSLKGKFTMALSTVALLAGVGLISTHAALAHSNHHDGDGSRDGRFVMIGSDSREVMHDGQGPNIMVIEGNNNRDNRDNVRDNRDHDMGDRSDD